MMTKPIMIALLVLALFGAGAVFVVHQRNIGAAKAEAAMKAKYDAGFEAAAAEVKADEARRREATEKAHAEDVQRADQRHAADLVTQSRLERLLSRTAAAGRAAEGGMDPAGSGPPNAAQVFRGLFESCAVEYASMGKERGELADQVIGLQDYLQANGIVGDSPVGERLRAGVPISLVTQPTTVPQRSIQAEAVPPQ